MAVSVAASTSQMTHKRHRKDLPNIEESYGCDYEDDQNLRKRSRHQFLSEILLLDDASDLDTVQDELVMNVTKDIEQEISGISQISATNGYNHMERNVKSGDKDNAGEVEEIAATSSSYEYLASATDDELGIVPNPPVTVDENEAWNNSLMFWTDLFVDSMESSLTAENVEMLEPWLLCCYSGNYKDYSVCNGFVDDTERQEWTAQTPEDWF